ncbi:MAG TPA: 50S ribosomal protein L3 N(5)-glutamine methyltransferase, partial [Rheinheimera sp.]|nr:50S ribosomal protein L3 N(5)-glutamine methyltransferase [Rheinheimera sp.]
MSDTGEMLFTPELISDAVAELVTVHDWLRFAVSKLNQSEAYLGHGTDNPWDEAALLLCHVLHLPPLTDDKLLSTRLIR